MAAQAGAAAASSTPLAVGSSPEALGQHQRTAWGLGRGSGPAVQRIIHDDPLLSYSATAVQSGTGGGEGTAAGPGVPMSEVDLLSQVSAGAAAAGLGPGEIGSGAAMPGTRGVQGASGRGGWMDMDDWSDEVSTSVVNTHSQDQHRGAGEAAGGQGREGAQDEGGRQDEERRHALIRGFQERTGAVEGPHGEGA